MKTKHHPTYLLAWCAVSLMATASRAQEQYAAPGDLSTIEVPLRDTLRERLDEAPWQVGKLRIQPRLSFGNLEYVDNVFDINDDAVDNENGDAEQPISDWRAGAAAGLDVYLPVGEDTVLSTFVRPSYSWWRDNDQLRRFNLSYGAAAFGFFNRVATDFVLRRTESEARLNDELRIPVTTRQDRASLAARIAISGPWGIFGEATLLETRFPNAEDFAERAPDLLQLERDEEVTGIGVSYKVEDRVSVAAGWRQIDAELLIDPNGRSNSGGFPFLRLSLPGNRVQFAAEIGLRKLEFDNREALGERDETVGTVQTSWRIATRTGAGIYSSRRVPYSALDAGSYFINERTGASLTWGVDRPNNVRLFVETGTDEFVSVGGSNLGRLDDHTAFGIQFDLQLRKHLVLVLGVTDTDVDSNFDNFDRSLTALRTTVRINLPEFPF